MSGLEWFVNRLSVMPPAEVALRVQRAVAGRADQARLAAGRLPVPEGRLRGTRPLFGADLCLDAYAERFGLPAAALDRVAGGWIRMFGCDYSLGDPPQWHRDPRTGTVAPLAYGKRIDYRDPQQVGDIKTLWEPARHQHLVPLAVSYAVTGNRRHRDALVHQIDSWVEQNPFGRGVHWCSALEVALRGIAWSVIHGLLAVREGEAGLPGASARPEALVHSVFQHGYFVRRNLSRYSSANNHLIGELVGLWTLARTFEFEQHSGEWATTAAVELEREAGLQVTPDGVAREQALHYHLEDMEYLLFAWCVGAATDRPLSPELLERVSAMAAFLRSVTPERDLPPRIGDSDEATVNRFAPVAPADPYGDVLAAVDAVLDPGKAPATEKAFWYQRLARGTGGVEDTVAKPRRGVTAFPQGGYAVIRTEDALLVFDAGPLGYPAMAAHGHADALSFCLAWQGVWWLVDPGTFAYHDQRRWRDYFRSTAAHNTLTVDGVDQSRMGGPFLWLTRAPARLCPARETGAVLECGGYHDGYAGRGVRHRRRVRYERENGRIRVMDVIQAAERAHRLDLYFHFAPEVDLVLQDQSAVARRADCGGSLVLTLPEDWTWRTVRGAEDPILGWYSPMLGRRQPCWTLHGRRDDSLSGDWTTCLSLQRGGAA